MDETERCPYCERDVLKRTLLMHQVHCQRFIMLCPDCREPVPKTEIDQHKSEAHSLIECNNCHKPVEKFLLDSHQVECPNRPVTCDYCELTCLASNVEEHKEVCGSRTDACPTCGNYILIRMMEAHAALHEKPNESRVLQGVKTRNVALKTLLEGKQAAVEPIAPAAALVEREPVPMVMPFGETAQDCEALVPCDFCHVEFSLFEINEHEIICSHHCETAKLETGIKYEESCTNLEPDSHASPYLLEEACWDGYEPAAVEVNDGGVGPEEVFLPCEICGAQYPLENLELHQLSCKFSEGAISPVVSNPPSITPELKSNLLEEVPCEHCAVLIPVSKLQIHEIGCARDQIRRQREQNRSNVHPNDTFNRIFNDSQVPRAAAQKKPNTPKPINTRIENPIQRQIRQKNLEASESRMETNPQKPIRQSQYEVVRLPNGTELLKKRNVGNDADHIDPGHVLGRSDRFAQDWNPASKESFKDPLPVMVREKGSPGSFQSGAGPANRRPANPKVNNQAQLSKKPNAAFKNYAYQPDPGHVLGGRTRSVPGEERRARTLAVANVDMQPNLDDYKGAKPKRPMRH